MASGMPSRRRQISATASAFDASKTKSARAARARSVKSRTASAPASTSGALARSPSGNDRSGHTFSPSIARPSRLVARSCTPGTAAGSSRRQRARRFEDVLAVVEHEKQTLGASSRRCSSSSDIAAGLDAEGDGDDLGHRVVIVRRGELAEPRAVGEARKHLRGDLERLAGLADSPDSGDRDESPVVERLSRSRPAPLRVQRTTSPAQAGCPDTCRPIAGAEHSGETGCVDLEDALGRLRSRNRCSPRSISSTPSGSESRTSCSVACDTRIWPPCPMLSRRAAAIHRRTEVVTLTELRHPGMQTDPHPQGLAHRPPLGAHRHHAVDRARTAASAVTNTACTPSPRPFTTWPPRAATTSRKIAS